MSIQRKPAALAVVIPCYNEEEVLPETVKQLTVLMQEMEQEELIDAGSAIWFVDDGSKDKTWELIEGYVVSNPYIRGLKLARNRGHQNALLAGLENATGDVLISIDADLQDDIQVLKTMMAEYHKGIDVVYGVRSVRELDTPFKRITAEGYYHLLKKMGVNIVFNHADFRLMSRRAIEALKSYEEVNLFLRGIIPTIGFPSSTVEYARAARFAGESKYPLKKMLALAADGITSFSAVPLRLIAALGFIIFLCSLGLSTWVFFVKLFTNNATPGWASSVLPMYVLGGIQLLSIGVLGEYVAKMYMETKKRPRYFLEKISPAKLLKDH
jgi:glycosyltransferase involved in cell wall biosynthesis